MYFDFKWTLEIDFYQRHYIVKIYFCGQLYRFIFTSHVFTLIIYNNVLIKTLNVA